MVSEKLSGRRKGQLAESAPQQDNTVGVMFDDDDAVVNGKPHISSDLPTRTELDERLVDAGSINEIQAGPKKQRHKFKGEYIILADGDLWAVE